MEYEDDSPLLDRDCGPVFRNLDLTFYVGEGRQGTMLEYGIDSAELDALKTQLNLWFGKLENGMCVLNEGTIDTRRDYRVGSYFVAIDLTDENNLVNLLWFFDAGQAMQEVSSLGADGEIDMLQNCIIGFRRDEEGNEIPFAMIFAQGRWFSPEVAALLRNGREALREIAQLPDDE